MTDEIATVEKQAAPLQKLDDMLAGAERLGAWIAKSGSFNCKTEAQANLIAFTILSEGGSIREFKNTYHVTDKGDAVMRVDAMMGKFQRMGGEWEVIEQTTERCEVKFSYKGVTTTGAFTIEQAREKGLLKGAWLSWPEDMLYSTVCRKTVRRILPSEFAGNYGEEEMSYDMTPSRPALPAAAAPILTPAPAAKVEKKAEKIIETTATETPEPEKKAETAAVTVNIDELIAALDKAGVSPIECMEMYRARKIITCAANTPVNDALSLIPEKNRASILAAPDRFAVAYVNWAADRDEADAKGAGLVSEGTPDAAEGKGEGDADGPTNDAPKLSDALKAKGCKASDAVAYLRHARWIPEGTSARWNLLDELKAEHAEKIMAAPDSFIKKAQQWVKENKGEAL